MESLERFMVAIPKHGGNKTTWGKWKKVGLKATVALLSQNSYSSILPGFLFRRVVYTVLFGTEHHIQTSPSLLTPGQTDSVVPPLSPYCCWFWAAGRAQFFSHYIFFSLTSSVISRVFALFQPEGRAESFDNWVRKRPLLLGCNLLTFCYLPPGDQLIFYVLTQYEILVSCFLSFLDKKGSYLRNWARYHCSVLLGHGKSCIVSTPLAL